MASPESKAQRYVFFAEREAAKIPDVPADTPAKDDQAAAVIGAGTMGGGIAMNFANAGIPVTVVEVDPGGARPRPRRRPQELRGHRRRKGRLTAGRRREAHGPHHAARSTATAIADADIVIEAVFEEMDVKKEVFAELDAIAQARRDPRLATPRRSTSTRSPSATTRPRAA